MSALWVLPLVTAAIGMVAVAVAANRSADEAGRLRRTVGGLGELRPAVVDTSARVRALRATIRETGRT